MSNSVILSCRCTVVRFDAQFFRPNSSTVILNHPVICISRATSCLSLHAMCQLVLVTEILLK